MISPHAGLKDEAVLGHEQGGVAGLHGDKELYASGYTPKALAEWARKIRSWTAGRSPKGTRTFGKGPTPQRSARDVYVYFDNDVKVRAPFDAMNLAHQLGLGPAPGRPPPASKISETPRRDWPWFR